MSPARAPLARASAGGGRAPFRWPVLERVPLIRLFGPLPTRRAGRDAAPGAAQPLWRDPLALALAVLAIVLDGALALVLWRQFETFPELIALHFNAYGEVDLIGGKNEIFKLPVIGAGIWATNVVLAFAGWRFDRVLARLLLGVSVLVQVIFAVAAWRILS